MAHRRFQDVTWSLLLGRDLGLAPPSSQDTIKFPYLENGDFDQVPWSHSSSDSPSVPPPPGFLPTIFSETCKLFCIGREVSEAV